MTVSNKFLQQLNNKFSKIHPVDFAKSFFKEHADVGTAVVSVLSNTGIAGFKFHLPESEQIKLQSEITDHYTDSNTVIQDHVARKPVYITLRGLQGDFFYSVNKIEDTLALVVPTMTLCKQFIPKISNATVQTKLKWAKYQKSLETAKEANKKMSLLDKTKEGWQTLNGVDLFRLFQEVYKLKSAQTRAFFYLEAMWQSNKPFTVETTWRRYDNAMIENLIVLRDKNADITDFTVTFKIMNFAHSQYTDLKNVAKLTRQQLMKKVNKGVSKGKEVKAV